MTPIGTALLKSLTDTAANWAPDSSCDGLRHIPTGMIVGLSIKNCVVFLLDGAICNDVLSPEDHLELYKRVCDMLASHKSDLASRQRIRLAKILKLEPQ